MPGQRPLGKVDARYLALQRAAQELGGVHHPDAVGQHQVGPVEGLPEGLLPPGPVHQLGVGGHNIVEAPLLYHPGGRAGRLVQGQVVKADPHDLCPQGTCLHFHHSQPSYHRSAQKSIGTCPPFRKFHEKLSIDFLKKEAIIQTIL